MNPGNQPLTNIEYNSFLNELAPFLKMGQTLHSAIQDAGLYKHKTAIYSKYRLKDDFAEKIDIFRSYPGKIANNILVRRVMQVDEKMKQGLPISEEEMKDVRFIAEKHRSSQPYFVNRMETTPAQPIEELIEELNQQGNDTIDDVAEWAKKTLEQNQEAATLPTL